MTSIHLQTFLAEDGLELHGLLHQGEIPQKSCVIHVHGLGGNFYKDWYREQFANMYQQYGYDFFTFNNRGSEFVKRMKYPTEDRQRYLGYSFELFEEAVFDLFGAMDVLKSLGYTRFILQGHSSGCQKIISYLYERSPEEVMGVVLLSPCDDKGLLLSDFGKKGFEEKLEYSKKNSGLITDPNFFMSMPVSAETYTSHFREGSGFDCFHYHDLHRPFQELLKNRLPTLVLFGEFDYFTDWQSIAQTYAPLANYTLCKVLGAGHKYDECWPSLHQECTSWMKQQELMAS